MARVHAEESLEEAAHAVQWDTVDVRQCLVEQEVDRRLEEFVRQAQAHGVTLDKGSDFERGLALLMVRRRQASDKKEASGLYG